MEVLAVVQMRKCRRQDGGDGEGDEAPVGL